MSFRCRSSSCEWELEKPLSLTPAEIADFRRMSDISHVRAIVERYFYGLDARDEASLISCFADDGYFEANTGRGRKISFNGAQEIGSTLCRLMGRVVFTMHTCGSPSIRVDGDRATTDVFGMARMVYAEDADHELAGMISVRGLRYQDDFERRDGEWKIVKRIHNVLWQFDAKSVPPFVPPSKEVG